MEPKIPVKGADCAKEFEFTVGGTGKPGHCPKQQIRWNGLACLLFPCRISRMGNLIQPNVEVPVAFKTGSGAHQLEMNGAAAIFTVGEYLAFEQCYIVGCAVLAMENAVDPALRDRLCGPEKRQRNGVRRHWRDMAH